MKILMAAPFDTKGRYKGGIGSVVNTMLEHKKELDENSLDIVEFNTCVVERSVDSAEKLGFANIKNTLILYNSISKEINRIIPDVLYYHSSTGLALLKDLLIIRHAKRKTKIKTIIHIHAADYSHISSRYEIANKLVMRFLKKYTDRIVFLSKATMKDFIARGIDEKKCDVIYNFSTIDSLEDEQLKFYNEGNPLNLLFVGYIDPGKGIFDLMDVLYKIKDNNIILHVCGTPLNKAREDILNEYKEKLGDKLIYHGFVSGKDKVSIYKDSDILILPSYAEGLPMVILEAFATGCAVISTDVGAIPEILGKKNGIIIKPRDKKALEEAILYYVKDTSELVSTQKENIKYSADFTCGAFIEKVAQACEKAIN